MKSDLLGWMWSTTFLGLLLSNVTTAFAEDDEPAATPYRPSVSSPAALSAPGWLDVELGWQRTRGGDDKTRESYPVTAKLAFSKEWGVVIGSELGVSRTDLDNSVFTGVGDTTFLIKHRIPTTNADTAWGIATGFKSPTAKDTIGSGKADAIFTGIFSTDFSDSNHLDLNLTVTRLGSFASGEGRLQFAWAAALSHTLDEKWAVFGEPSGTYQSGASSTSQLLFGTSYGYSKRVVFDLAVAQGLNGHTSDWQMMGGLTVLLGRLW